MTNDLTRPDAQYEDMLGSVAADWELHSGLTQLCHACGVDIEGRFPVGMKIDKRGWASDDSQVALRCSVFSVDAGTVGGSVESILKNFEGRRALPVTEHVFDIPLTQFLRLFKSFSFSMKTKSLEHLQFSPDRG